VLRGQAISELQGVTEVQAISELQGVTEVRCHTILLAARHKQGAHPALTPASKAVTRSTYPGGMEG